MGKIVHPAERQKVVTCELCGVEFVARKKNTKYCIECKDKRRRKALLKYRRKT